MKTHGHLERLMLPSERIGFLLLHNRCLLMTINCLLATACIELNSLIWYVRQVILLLIIWASMRLLVVVVALPDSSSTFAAKLTIVHQVVIICRSTHLMQVIQIHSSRSSSALILLLICLLDLLQRQVLLMIHIHPLGFIVGQLELLLLLVPENLSPLDLYAVEVLQVRQPLDDRVHLRLFIETDV
jgi:hypothetical protein